MRKILSTIIAATALCCGCSSLNYNLAEEELLQNAVSFYLANPDSTYRINYDENLSPLYMQADLKVLKLILEEAHTGIYRYASKAEVDREFSKALQKAEVPLSYIAFVRLIAKIQNKIACGHSGFSHPKSYIKYRNENIGLFPLEVLIIKGKYVVKRNNSLNKDINEYAEITHINGITVDKTTQKLKEFVARDGNSNPNGTQVIERYFSTAYSNFIGNPPGFSVLIKNPGSSSPKLFTVQPLQAKEIDSIRESRYKVSGFGKPLESYYIDSLHTLLYTIKWFNNEYIRAQGQDFISFTDSVFKEIKKQEINNLVIDLRGNTGGWTANGAHLFSYFIKDSTDFIKQVTIKKYKDYSFEPLIVAEAGYNDTFELQLNNSNLYQWRNYPSSVVYPSKSNHFNGYCYVLIDDMSRSCSAILASLMKEHTEAVLIGEETGAAQCGANSMVMSIKLPYTRLGISFSTACYLNNIADTDNSRGVIPDIEILPSLEDIINEQDKVRDSILAIIGHRKLY